jgi:hypothetical protein
MVIEHISDGHQPHFIVGLVEPFDLINCFQGRCLSFEHGLLAD